MMSDDEIARRLRAWWHADRDSPGHDLPSEWMGVPKGELRAWCDKYFLPPESPPQQPDDTAAVVAITTVFILVVLAMGFHVISQWGK